MLFLSHCAGPGGPSGSGHEAHGAGGVRASLLAPSCPGARGIADDAADRGAGRPDRGPRAQADAPAATRGAGEERSRPQGGLPTRPAGRADQRRRRARLVGRQPLLHRLLRPARRQRAHLRAQRRLLHPLALDRHRPGGAARTAEDAAQRPAAQRARDGRLDPLPTRGLSLEDYVVSTAATIQELTSRQYKYGFVTEIESDSVPRGLNEEIIRLISAKKNEPAFMLEWCLQAFRHWLTIQEPRRQTIR